MEGFLATLDWPTAAPWGAFAVGVALHVVVEARRLRRLFREWQLERRLARDPYILREEMNEHLLALGDEPEPIRPGEVVRDALLAGVFCAVPVWLAEQHLEKWWEIAWFGFLGLAILMSTWRWLNDPDSDPAVLKLPDAEVPREAMTGFAAAIGIVALMVASIFWFF